MQNGNIFLWREWGFTDILNSFWVGPMPDIPDLFW